MKRIVISEEAKADSSLDGLDETYLIGRSYATGASSRAATHFTYCGRRRRVLLEAAEVKGAYGSPSSESTLDDNQSSQAWDVFSDQFWQRPFDISRLLFENGDELIRVQVILVLNKPIWRNAFNSTMLQG